MGALDDKVAIVTGSGQGVGRGVALAFAKEGAAIAVVELNAETGPRVATEIRELGGRALFIQCDVRFRDQVNNAVAATVKEFGTVDILVNNAMARYRLPLEEMTDECMNLSWQSGPMACLYFMQACFPYFRDKRSGKIINVGSGAAINGVATHGAYSMAKNAILCLTRVATREWGVHNINVNSFCPLSESPAAEKWQKDHPEAHKAVLQHSGMKRVGDPEKDIGRAVVFLASSASDFVSGQCIGIDGGYLMLN